MRQLYRSQTDKKIAGILGGIGEVYSVDPTLLRLLSVFVGLATGILPFLVTYLVGWIIIPKGPTSLDLRGSGQG
ncbi:MAG: PspC domain-containing protein [Acidobacteria bacterium]|nr:PspC domain-containing protein [Acidobacteriota bacterium]